MSEVIIRKMGAEEIETVHRLLIGCWPIEDKWIRESLWHELQDMFNAANFRPTFYVAEVENEIVGVAGWNWSWFNYDNYELFWMFVREDVRKRGIGTQLYNARVAEIVSRYKRPDAPVFLWLTTPLVERYARFGHNVVLTAPGTVDGASDTRIMVRRIG